MIERRNLFIKKSGIVLSLAFCYYLFTQLTGYAVPCFFHVLTGLQCPGCGISRMCVHLLHFRFRDAFACNQLCFLLTPIYLIILSKSEIQYIRTGKRHFSKAENTFFLFTLLLLLGFGICRNLGSF